MRTIKRWLLVKLIHHCYEGITPEDFIDLSGLDEKAAFNYCLSAEEVWLNETFQTEIKRLRYVQERYIANKAQTAEDMIFGRAVLYTIKEIVDRFESLALKAQTERDNQKNESVST